LNHRKAKKAEPSRLIPRKLAANLKLINVGGPGLLPFRHYFLIYELT